MLFEIAYIDGCGQIVRGGIKAPILTVGKWIEEAIQADPDGVYIAVVSDNDAITITEYNR